MNDKPKNLNYSAIMCPSEPSSMELIKYLANSLLGHSGLQCIFTISCLDSTHMSLYCFQLFVVYGTRQASTRPKHLGSAFANVEK